MTSTEPLPPGVWRANALAHDQQERCASSGFAALDRELPGGGWPQGRLIELLVDHPGIGELSLLQPALAAATKRGASCAWVLPCERHPAAEPAALPYAPALAQAGLDPADHIFIRPDSPRESHWALEQCLRSGQLGAVLGWIPDTQGPDAGFHALRRLHLLAQRSRTLVFILRSPHNARTPSPAALRIRLRDDAGRLSACILKRRGQPLLDPVLLPVHPAEWRDAMAGSSCETPSPEPAALKNGMTTSARSAVRRPASRSRSGSSTSSRYGLMSYIGLLPELYA